MGNGKRGDEVGIVTNVVDSLPSQLRPLFVEIVGAADPELLGSLRSHAEPTPDEIKAVQDVLSYEFTRCLQPDDEPTERGRQVDDLIGAFVLRWLIQKDATTES
ncbi:MAG: hypothetical protein ABSB09_08995 [Acidimicrobiales bacterium]|jgi:hypothetical protein